jgi:NhaA family Na+:H+ antiporter
MLAPVLIYLVFAGGGPHSGGWGVPMGTDTAFALGILALLGRRAPLALRVFVAAAAIADDVGAIIVIAFFYSANVSVPALGLAALCFAAAIGLNRARVYRALPYAVVGVLLWLAVLYSGVHPTLAGVLLAFAVPTRSEPNAGALLAQTQSVLHTVDAPAVGTSLESRYQAAVRALEAVVERLLSPAQRMARNVQPWSAYVALPVFAFANAGVELDVGIREFLHPASLGIFFGLFVGKPLGIAGGAWLAVRSGLAVRPNDIKWPQVIAAGFLCGIGFTMSFFIANAAYSDTHVLALAKLSVLAASVTAAVTGWLSFRALHARLEQRSRAQRTPAPE